MLAGSASGSRQPRAICRARSSISGVSTSDVRPQATGSRAILLDEPFAAIDQRTTGDLLALVQRWHGEGRTVIAVLHDLEQVRAHFPETLLLAREPVAWGRTAEVLTPEMLERARQIALGWRDPEAEPASKIVPLSRRRRR